MVAMNNKNKVRDESLDIYRTFAMMWVIVIHCIFWMGLWGTTSTSDILRSLLLFEMPLFFFVMGAVNYKSTKSLVSYYLTRLQRIMIPYWIFAGICILFSIFILAVVNGQNIDAISMIIDWFIPISVSSSLPYLTSALWFISAYILVVFAFPFSMLLRRNDQLFRGVGKYIPLLILPVGIIGLDIVGFGVTYIRYMLFYLFWAYLGTFYDDIKQESKRKTQIAIFILIFTICLIILLGSFSLFSYNMQTNKFPPNIMFFIYSLGVMSLLYLLRNWIVCIFQKLERSIFSPIIHEYKYHSLSVFLYQPFAFCLLAVIRVMIPIQWDLLPPVILLIFYLVVTIPACAILGKIFGRFESVELIHVNNKKI